jgi:hypothetical protein
MPKRKTADAPAEAALAAEPRKKASTAKPKTAAATHKRTSPAPKSKAMAEIVDVVTDAAVTVSEPEPSLATAATVRVPEHSQIAALAYSYWESRGFQGGSSEEDWLRAERELSQAG